ncbi:hypothetical protein [Marinomonas flavescens]|nr:hypothetical protein [Marinomonas flavescens]
MPRHFTTLTVFHSSNDVIGNFFMQVGFHCDSPNSSHGNASAVSRDAD